MMCLILDVIPYPDCFYPIIYHLPGINKSIKTLFFIKAFFPKHPTYRLIHITFSEVGYTVDCARGENKFLYIEVF